MNKSYLAAVAVALAVGAGSFAAQAQVPTTLNTPGASPRDNSGAGSSRVDTSPRLSAPQTSRSQYGSSPRDNSAAGSSAVDTRPMNRTGTTFSSSGSTPTDNSSAGSSAVDGGPGTGQARLRRYSRGRPVAAAQTRSSDAYMGGGGVFERGADGSLRPAR